MKALSFIFLLVAGVLLAGSESEYFLGNIIGMIILFIAGDKLVEQDNNIDPHVGASGPAYHVWMSRR